MAANNLKVIYDNVIDYGTTTVSADSVAGTSYAAANLKKDAKSQTWRSNNSKTANGYVFLANGVLHQWGAVLANTTTGNATFSIAFPTACQSVVLSVIGSSNVAYQAASPNTTVATIRTTSTTTGVNVQYQAIGY